MDLSSAYKLTLDTGWDVPPGVLHAPGSLCTYEPQFASDVYAMYQSVLYGGQCVSEELLWKDCPDNYKGDYDYLMEVIDWELNVDPKFRENRFMKPIPIKNKEEMSISGCIEEWICYKCKGVCAKRVTVKAGRTVMLQDAAAYGMICIQGQGKFGDYILETPTLIHYGEITNDEFFVAESAAIKGIIIENTSLNEDVVILQHFAENKEMEKYL